MADVAQQLQDLQRKFDQAVAEVQADRTRSQEYKSKQQAQLYEAATEDYKRILDAEKEKLETEVRIARRLCFMPQLPGAKDPSTLWSDYRSCIERAKAQKTPGDLQKLLQASELIGDDLQAQACVIQAFELHDDATVSAYYEFRPGQEKAWDTFMLATQKLKDFNRESYRWGVASRFRKPDMQYSA